MIRIPYGSPVGPGPTQLLVIQATPFCNINCDYCYLPDRGNRRRITTETLTLVFEQVLALPCVTNDLSIVWHAGEPLTLPVEFYQEAVRLAATSNRRQIRITHSFQTNGIGINRRWCTFFREARAEVGVSIDGPKFIYDAHRKTKTGSSTFDLVMKGVVRLRESDIPFTTISVITSDSLPHAAEIVSFLHSIGSTQIGFNVEEIEGPHVDSSLECDGAEKALQSFFRTADATAQRLGIAVREFKNLRSFRDGERTSLFNSQAIPLTMINVDVAGNVSTFSPELLGVTHPRYGSLSFLNVHTGRLDQLLQSQSLRLVFADIVAGVESCRRTCEYFAYCAGGAPGNKLFENGTFCSTETMYCRSHVKAIVEALELPKIEA